MIASGKVKVAVVQATPCLFDLQASVDKTVSLIRRAGEAGANIILFPEVFIGGYPLGMTFGISMGFGSMEGKRDFARYYNGAIQLPGCGAPTPEADRIAKAAAEANAYVVIGCLEKVPHNGTLYCTAAFWGPDGNFLGRHRKIKPTTAERYFWGEGDGSTIPAFETPWGRMGALICWENMVPQLRCVLYGKGVGIYLAPTMDYGEKWHISVRHIAQEGRCFVLSCTPYQTKDAFPKDLNTYTELDAYPEETLICPGGSAIIDPFGNYLAGPLYGEEGILSAELDLEMLAMGRFSLDVAGHYSRPDLIRMYVNESAQATFNYVNGDLNAVDRTVFSEEA